MNASVTRPHREWSSRPADQRFETLDDLEAMVTDRRARSSEWTVPLSKVVVSADADNGVVVNGAVVPMRPNNWAFGQLCRAAGAPAGFLRDLTAETTAKALNEKLANAASDDHQFMAIERQDEMELASITSPTYGRVWDALLVAEVKKIVERTNGAFFNPKDWSGRPSGLYGSDRDVFMFLIDGGSIVDGGGERDQLHRGFYVWNSEVGRTSIGISTFLFRGCCGNHTIWGAEQVVEMRFRHSLRAPERLAAEMLPAIGTYVTSSVGPVEAAVKRAKAYEIPTKLEDLQAFALRFGISKLELASAVALAEREEGRCASAWELAQGLTAFARQKTWVDARVDLERRAGQMLDAVAAIAA